MEETKSVITRDFDRSGHYEAGLQALVKSLRWAFGLLLVAIIGMLIYFITWGGYFTVEPQQAVIVMRFGKVIDCFTSGGHWYLPYPVNRFVRVQVNQQFLNVNFIAPELPGQVPTSLTPGKDNYLLTGDANIVHTSWTIGYRISDPVRYYETLSTPLKPVDNGRVVADEEIIDADGFAGTRGPQTLLRNLFREAVIEVTGVNKVDEILAAGQGRYSEEVQRRFAALVNKANCGIVIETVTLSKIAPPSHTKGAFDAVTAASNTQDTLKNEAQAYRIQTENDTLAQTAEILAAAQTYKRQFVASIEAESNYFKSINKEYAQNPKTVLMALYTSALSEALDKMEGDKFVLGSSAKNKKQVWMKLNPEPKNKVAAEPKAEEK